MIINLENALAVARDPGGRSRDELVVSAAYLASEVEKLQGIEERARAVAEDAGKSGQVRRNALYILGELTP